MTQLSLPPLSPLRSRFPADALGISGELDAADERALSIVCGLTDAQGGWRAHPSLPCVSDCLEQYCDWLRRAVPVLDAGVRGVRSGWRARLGKVRSGWWWRLLPRLAEFAPDVLLQRPMPCRGERRPVREAMREVLALHAELRRVVRDGEQRDLRTAAVRLPGLGSIDCPIDVALAMVPAVWRRLLRRAERVRLEAGFPRC